MSPAKPKSKSKPGRKPGGSNSVAHREIEAMSSITIGATAWLLGVSTTTLRNNLQDYQPNAQGKFNAATVVSLLRQKLAITIEDEDRAKAKLAVEKARIHELKRIQMEGNLVDVQLLKDQLSEMVRHLRTVGDGLKRRYGMDAANLLNKGLNECQRTIGNLSGGQSAIDSLDRAGVDDLGSEDSD